MAVSGVASANPWAIGASVLGSVASGVAEAKARAEENKNRARQLQAEQQQFNQKLGEDQRQFNNNFGQTQYKQNIDAQSQYGDRAQSVNRELEVLPMRDKAAALLMQRMGNPAVQTTARSLAGGLAGRVDRVDPGINRRGERQQRRRRLPPADGRQVQALEQIPERLARAVGVGRQRVYGRGVHAELGV